MGGSARRVRFLTALLAAAVLAGCAVGVSGSDGPAGSQTETAAQDHAGVTRVEVTGDAADVDLRKGPDGTAHVERSLRWSGTKPEVTEVVEGDLLRITTRCPDDVLDRCGVRLTITVGAATTARTDVGAGTVTVADLTGTQDHHTSAGNVRGTGLAAPEVRARSSAGNVELAFAAAPRRVEAESSAGNVAVRVPAGSYRVDASTSVGNTDVTVTDDPGASATITARSSVGNVSVGTA